MHFKEKHLKHKTHQSNNWITYGIYFLLLLCLAEAIFFLIVHTYKSSPFVEYTPPLHNALPAQTGKIEPEITKIINTRDIIKQASFYKQLIERIGPIKAQDALFTSGLPFDGQTHLLNHTVGEWLYSKYKNAGLIYCKDYFLSSCYHGFVISAIADGGIAAMSSIMDTCWKAPPGVSFQCAHAIGHGLLAFDGYKNLTKALAECDTVEQLSKNFPTYNCYDGVFMENIWGIHDGKPSPDRWINYNDQLYPCDDPRIAEKYIKACWSNQPQWMYQLFRGDLTRTAQECLKLTNNKDYQVTCFDSIAREIDPVSHGDPNEVVRLCSFMPSNWINPCIISNANAAFSVGDRILPFIICNKMQTQKEECLNALSGQIQYTTQKETPERKNLCGKITNTDIQKQCLENQLPSS